MNAHTPVRDGSGNIAFEVTPAGTCVRAGVGRFDPLKPFTSSSGKTKQVRLALVQTVRGIFGDTIECYQVRGGDYVRRVLTVQPQIRQAAGREWWEVA